MNSWKIEDRLITYGLVAMLISTIGIALLTAIRQPGIPVLVECPMSIGTLSLHETYIDAERSLVCVYREPRAK